MPCSLCTVHELRSLPSMFREELLSRHSPREVDGIMGNGNHMSIQLNSSP